MLRDFPPAFYPVAIFAILLTGISKSGFGGGAGGVAVPLMSIFIAPPEAAGIMLPILCAMDLFGMHAYRRTWSREHLRALLPGALAGIPAGALAFGSLPVNAIRLLIGLIAVAPLPGARRQRRSTDGGGARRRRVDRDPDGGGDRPAAA